MWTAESFLVSRCLAVVDGGSIGKCVRLSQPSWLLLRTTIESYLLTYLVSDPFR